MLDVQMSGAELSSVSAGEAAEILRRVCGAEGVTEGEISLSCVERDEMAALNERYRDVAGPTDVLSFTLGSGPEGEDGMLGDIVICPAVAAGNAAEAGISAAEEVKVLLVHGALHLLGYDHETDDGRMLARQVELIGEIP